MQKPEDLFSRGSVLLFYCMGTPTCQKTGNADELEQRKFLAVNKLTLCKRNMFSTLLKQTLLESHLNDPCDVD